MSRIAGAILTSMSLLCVLGLFVGGVALQAKNALVMPWWQYWPFHMLLLVYGMLGAGLWLLFRRE